MIQEICPEEIANAAYQVISMHISMGKEDFERATANIFGISRRGSAVRKYVEEGITLLQKRGLCQIEADNVQLVEDK